MTSLNDSQQQPVYPKKHLIAASGVAAMVSMVLAIYPSKEVEAKKATLDLPAEIHMATAAALPQQILTPLPQQTPPTQTSQLPPLDDIQPANSPNTAQDLLVSEQTEPSEPSKQSKQNTELRTVEVTVESGNTLSTLFEQQGIGHSLMMTILNENKEAQRFTNLKAGQVLTFTFAPDDSLLSLSSQLSPLETIEVSLDKESGKYSFSRHIQQTVKTDAVASGTIDSSLLAATQAAGMPYKLALDMANVFAYDIDFARDLRNGDSFEVVYEQKKLDDEVVGTGNILAARFTNKGKAYTAVRYTDKAGQTSYYNSDGTSSRRAFIRTPVDFARISSKFNPGRKHPILNRIRAHKGVDYAAPTGTPIKATGNGKISFVGNKNGYGKTIVIQHGNKYRTLYGHMNGYAKGMRNGTTVKQGQVIGYVGMTGLATGPHLHYEFHVNGVHVDPLSHKLPTADPIPKAEMARFKQATQSYVAMLDEAGSTALAKAGNDN